MLKGRRSSRSLVSWETGEEYPASREAYELLEEIGRGATARVWLANCKHTGTKVAIKLVDLERHQGKTALDQLISEAHFMKGLMHPNLLQLYCSFVDGQDLWLVMPFIAGGTLANILASRYPEGMDDEDMVATIARDVLTGLEYLHENGSMHRDLKAANLLVSDDGRILLADFGACATLEREAGMPSVHSALQRGSAAMQGSSPSDSSSPLSPSLPNVPEDHGDSATSWPSTPRDVARSAASSNSSTWHKYLSRTTFIGTASYMAPEVLDVREGYTQSADIWSFGIVLLELARGRVPRAEASFTALVMSTVHDPAPRLEQRAGAKRKFSAAMHDFVARCLNKDAEARVSASELLAHPFLARARDEHYLAQRLLGRGAAPLKASRSFLARAPGGVDTAHGRTQVGQGKQLEGAGKTSWKAKAAMKDCAVYQLVWTVYVQGKKHFIVFHMTMSHSEARLQINGVELLRRKYRLWQQLNFHADSFKAVVQATQLPQLAGKALELHVRAGMAGMSGHAVLDGTQLDDPQCSVSYADMSPAAASTPTPSKAPGVPYPSPFAAAAPEAAATVVPAEQGLKASSSAEALAPAGSESLASTLQPPELSSAVSVPHPDTLPVRRRAMTHTVSEDNLSSLESSAGERMKYALERLAL